MAGGPDRLPGRRRGDAAADARGLDAQPRPAADRELPHQDPVHRLARGARHFLELLVDGDLANNQLNWQWVAGTGTDTRPNRVLNPVAQARRHDPDGAYVRRWVPELAGIEGPAVHEPWKLSASERAACASYPDPVVDLSEGLARFRRARGRE